MLKADTFFGCLNNSGAAVGVWHFDGEVAVRIGVPNAITQESAHIRSDKSDNLLYQLALKLSILAPNGAPYTFEILNLKAGQFYPRMARPAAEQVGHPHAAYRSPSASSLASELASMRGQLVSLMQSAVNICQTINPCHENFNVYGHEIRNLLILACTEVEMHWRGILVANGCNISRNVTTNDYVHLAEVMRLAEYAIALPYYPWLDNFCPFVSWRLEAPTRTLPWYQAYNAVKHDREGSFSQATLGHALNAVVACAVMLIAQFGEQEAFRWRTEFGFFFHVQSVPVWRLSETYAQPFPEDRMEWNPVPYPFVPLRGRRAPKRGAT